jgi:exodeoxyribonuclease V alpha subunit
MPLTSNYPDEGLRLPFHLYKDKPEILERLAIFPEVTGNFKYATGVLSDDDALSVIEKFIEVVRYLQEIGDKSENWEKRAKWLFSLTAELWKARGPYPGMMKVLDYLEFTEAIEFFKTKTTNEEQKTAMEQIGQFLNGQSGQLNGVKIDEKRKTSIIRNWKLRDDGEKELLLGKLPLFDLSKLQISNILDENRGNNGISATLKAINQNPYILA